MREQLFEQLREKFYEGFDRLQTRNDSGLRAAEIYSDAYGEEGYFFELFNESHITKTQTKRHAKFEAALDFIELYGLSPNVKVLLNEDAISLEQSFISGEAA